MIVCGMIIIIIPHIRDGEMSVAVFTYIQILKYARGEEEKGRSLCLPVFG